MNDMCIDLAIGSGRDCALWRAFSCAWLLLLVFFLHPLVGAQSIYTATAPPADGSTTGLRVPNGTLEHAFQRSVSFVTAVDLALVPAGTKITRLGFVVSQGAGATVNGNMTIYMSNTPYTFSDQTMNWSDIVGSMTRVYTGTFAVPDTSGPIDVTLSSPFQYGGKGNSMYVAYEFQGSGPFTEQNAVFASNITLASSTRSGFSSTALPAVLNDVSGFRPVMRFGFPMPAFQWKKMNGGLQNDLICIDMADDTSAWVCSPAGHVYCTLDVGNTWLDAGSVQDSTYAILGLARRTAVSFAGAQSEASSLYSTYDGGLSWSKLNDPALNVRIAVVGKTSSTSLWCLGGGAGDTVMLLTSSTSGYTWTRSSTGIFMDAGVSIASGSGFRIGNVVWFGTRGSGNASGRVYRSSTGPRGPWQYSATGRANVAAIAFASASGTGIAAHVGCSDTIRRSTDGGLTWSAVAVAGLGEVRSLQYFAGGQDAWAATTTGVWHTSDDGLTWQQSFSLPGSSATLSSIRFFPNFQCGLAIGSSGFVARGAWVINTASGVSESSTQPSDNWMGLNYPNPFNSSTWIEYSVSWPSHVTLKLIDVLGREVATIVSGERDRGKFRVEWNAGQNPSGIYFCRLVARPLSGVQAMEYTQTQKLILLK